MSLQSLFQEIKKSFDEKQEGMFGAKPMKLDIADPMTYKKNVIKTHGKIKEFPYAGTDENEILRSGEFKAHIDHSNLRDMREDIHENLHKKMKRGKATAQDLKDLHHLTKWSKGEMKDHELDQHMSKHYDNYDQDELGGVELVKSMTQRLFDFFKSKKEDPGQGSMFNAPSVKLPTASAPKVPSSEKPKIFGTNRGTGTTDMYNSPPSDKTKVWHSLHPLSNPSPEEGREKHEAPDIRDVFPTKSTRRTKIKREHYQIHPISEKHNDDFGGMKFYTQYGAHQALHKGAKMAAEDHWAGNSDAYEGQGHTKSSFMENAIPNYKSRYVIRKHNASGESMEALEVKKGLWEFVKSMFDEGQGNMFGESPKGTEILHPKEVLKNFTETHLNDRGALKNQNSTLNHAKVFDTYKTLHDKHTTGGVGTQDKIIMHDIGKWSKGEVGDAQITKHINKFHNIDPQKEKRKDRLPYSHQADMSRINDKITNKQEVEPHEHNHKLLYDSYLAGKTPYSALRDHYDKHFGLNKPSTIGVGTVFKVQHGEGYTPEVKQKPKITMDDLRKQYTPTPEKSEHLTETSIVKPSRANTQEVTTMNAKKILESSLPTSKTNEGARSKFLRKEKRFSIEPHPEDSKKLNVHYKGSLISREQAERWDEAIHQGADSDSHLPDGVTPQQMRKIHAHYQREEKRDQPEVRRPNITKNLVHDPTGEAHIDTIKSHIKDHADQIIGLKLRSSKPENSPDLHNFLNNKKGYQEKYPHYHAHIHEAYEKHMNEIKADITKRAMIAAAKKKKKDEEEAGKRVMLNRSKNNPTGSWAHVKSGGGKVSKKTTGGKKSSWTNTSL